jgi:manganese/zinc/iron transport system substrate-binding protein
MKFFWNIIILLCACISCTAPDQSFQKWISPNGKVKVIATTSMIGDLVREIGGSHVDTLVLIRGELDPHSYELVKGDDEKLQYADIVFYNGLGLEHGASLSHFLKSNTNAFAVGEAVNRKVPEKILYTEEGTIDPHIWMDVSLWIEAAKEITNQFIQVDEKHTAFYQNNAKKLIQEMVQLEYFIKTTFQNIHPEKRYLVTSHDAFQYFARRYLADDNEDIAAKKERVCAPEGLAPEGEITPGDIEKVMQFLNRHNISVIFAESNVSPLSLKKISSDAKNRGLTVSIAQEKLYGDSMPSVDGNKIAYIEMLRHNATIIAEYLDR